MQNTKSRDTFSARRVAMLPLLSWTRSRQCIRAGAYRSKGRMTMTKHRIFTTAFSKVYPMYLQKAERKGRTKDEVDEAIRWLTGYGQELVRMLADDVLGSRRAVLTDPVEVGYAEAFATIESDPNNQLLVAVVDDVVVGTLQITFIPSAALTRSSVTHTRPLTGWRFADQSSVALLPIADDPRHIRQ